MTMLAAMCFGFVQAETGDGHYRFDTKTQTAELTFVTHDSLNATAYSGMLDVPTTIEQDGQAYTVTGVTPYACVYCDQLTEVTLPEGVTRIGFGAFSDCPRLTQVVLPTTLLSLGDWAFYHDESLHEVSLPASTPRIGVATFAFCVQLDKVEAQQGLRSIASQAFYYCTTLHEMRIPGTVCQIGEYAFAYCTSLQRLVMEAGPIAITDDVFEGVDVSACTLVVPTDQVEAYKEADVWRRFNIVDGGYDDLQEVASDEMLPSFEMKVLGQVLYLNALGDAPVLVYNLQGQRIAVAASHSGEQRIPLSRGQYIIKCGKESRIIAI